MFSCAHISDLHLLPLPKIAFYELLNKRISGYLNLKLNRDHYHSNEILQHIASNIKRAKLNHIIVSGDLVNLALKQEFINAKDWLENLAPAQNISLAFGNHDIYLKKSYSEACNIFSAYLKSDLNSEDFFPNVKIIDKIAVINVNSAIATPIFCAFGWFSAKQALELAKILQYCKAHNLFRIINIHHPPIAKLAPMHKRLYAIKNFTQTLVDHGAELILHGHIHKDSLNYLTINKSKIPVLGVGSASRKNNERLHCNFFHIEPKNLRSNLMDICLDNKEWSCFLSN